MRGTRTEVSHGELITLGELGCVEELSSRVKIFFKISDSTRFGEYGENEEGREEDWGGGRETTRCRRGYRKETSGR